MGPITIPPRLRTRSTATSREAGAVEDLRRLPDRLRAHARDGEARLLEHGLEVNPMWMPAPSRSNVRQTYWCMRWWSATVSR
ncbi:hypothetical protein BE20_13955 [Sorangium cellulosum]|nr:hypothetical protein BE20_13955 [Sorangium cellulosum]